MGRVLSACLVLAACSKDPVGDVGDALVDGTDGTSDGGDAGDVPDTAGETGTNETDTGDGDGEVVDPVCTLDLDCRLPCAEGRCVAGRCEYSGADTSASGCVIDETCVATGAASPQRACFFCNPAEDVAGFSARAFGDGFEVGAGRLLIEKLTPSSASWTISAARAASGTRSLYFGDATLRSYDVGERAAARASTPPLAVPDLVAGLPLTLSFQLFADTEETLGFDRLHVLVLPPEGSAAEPAEPVVAWTSDEIDGTTLGEFLPITIALGSLDPGQRVAFEADSIDDIINGFEGFYLDDVRVQSDCCDAGHPCDDGNACTTDACNDGACAFTTRGSCCLSDGDCDDGDPCSDDRCAAASDGEGGACVSTVRADCCALASDCNDDNPCTEDTCAIDTSGAGSCRQVPLCCARTADCEDGDSCTIGECLDGQCRYHSACCRDDADCDDQIACTVDRCETGVCTSAFTYEPGCCIPDVMTERFDLGAPDGWILSPPANNVGWRVQANANAPSGTSVLYYGHPTLNFYESGGRNSGTATSRLVRLPDGVEMRLSFQVFLDIEANPQRDLFRVEAVIGQTTILLVDKAELSRGSWQEVAVDLTWAASQAVQIRFVCDTVDGAQNTTRGVLIDDVRLLSSCLPRRCGVSAECGSRAECIEGSCEDGICRFGGGC